MLSSLRQRSTGHSRRPSISTVLIRLLQDLHRLRVGTLDSFFAQLATNFTLEMGLPPNWRIAEETEDQQLRSEAVALILRESPTDDIVRLTNLLSKGDAHRSVSGLIHEAVSNYYDVFCESDESAWRRFPESRRLTDEQIEDAVDRLEAAAIPKDKRAEKARASDAQQARDQDWENFPKSGIAKKVFCGDQTFFNKQLPDELVAAYQRLLDHVRAVHVQELAVQTRATWELLNRFEQQYRQLKQERRSVRFDDVTHRLRQLLSGRDPDGIAYRLDGRIAHPAP